MVDEMEEVKEIRRCVKEQDEAETIGRITMTFEEKLSQMYNEIANEISGMIPIEWEKVYTMAYIDDGGGERVFYYYTEPGQQ